MIYTKKANGVFFYYHNEWDRKIAASRKHCLAWWLTDDRESANLRETNKARATLYQQGSHFS